METVQAPVAPPQSAEESIFLSRWPLWASLVLLLGFLAVAQVTTVPKAIEIILMLAAYLLAGHETLRKAGRNVARGDFFNEFTLMTTATLGAFYIGEYAEGVAVMVFYEIGELFQDLAVSRSKRSIKALLDVRPDQVTALRNGQAVDVSPFDVTPGEVIRVKPGEKVALDGLLLSPAVSFNTAALTGESRPDTRREGDSVLAGMISLDREAEIRVTTAFKDSKLSRILDMVQHATARKAPTQLFISRFAKIYTPIVFALAVCLIFLPALFVSPYDFSTWLYRGMIFLVISCPCALTVSIPLGYFGGIGLASRNGILVKGSNFLDVLTEIRTLVSDKTGTLTKGTFEVQQVESALPDRNELIRLAALIESRSTHPVATAVTAYAAANGITPSGTLNDLREIAGHGLQAVIDGKTVLCGNLKLLDKEGITYPSDLKNRVETLVVVALDGNYAGCFTIADEVKEDAAEAVRKLAQLGVETVMLSGDKSSVVQKVAGELGIRTAYGDLLPEQKVEKVQALKDAGHKLAFVGDGVNDAPVVALADVGIAMGGLGSDATIETADVVIQNDQPSKLATAIRIGKLTKSVVWQNIGLAMGVKIIVMALGAGGVATLWEAVFADVGVALLAILNAYRIQARKL
ncbi:heavy metal translocating P-type ATPase [Siphonobacter aquaeclarae]|uniref:P-type Zn(2+) transporter n=1 Tax=Siphonobacter aquaeclarae TaxID=563176 RepID=A0A1G9PWH3_9BACT|nr:heavy metal translocating P-type ATPase [Siphonobacter aquaeclarae]SDM03110.1 Cd2+/Zn2+-exporting ATPase [Siphonobacter aquaeclarae]